MVIHEKWLYTILDQKKWSKKEKVYRWARRSVLQSLQSEQM